MLFIKQLIINVMIVSTRSSGSSGENKTLHGLSSNNQIIHKPILTKQQSRILRNSARRQSLSQSLSLAAVGLFANKTLTPRYLNNKFRTMGSKNLLFDRIGLDSKYLKVKHPLDESHTNELAKQYIKEQKFKLKRQVWVYLFDKGYCLTRLILIHPDTDESYLEFVTEYKTTNKHGRYAKRFYVNKLEGFTYNELRLMHHSPFNSNEATLINQQTSDKMLIFLAQKGAIYKLIGEINVPLKLIKK